jgi:hypothetical protein
MKQNSSRDMYALASPVLNIPYFKEMNQAKDINQIKDRSKSVLKGPAAIMLINTHSDYTDEPTSLYRDSSRSNDKT